MSGMGSALTTKAVILQTLRHGPGYGRALIRAIRRTGRDVSAAAPGTVYPALEALVGSGLVRAWKVVPGARRGGRSRTYYELTRSGIARADRQRQALLRLLRPAEEGREDLSLMRARIERGAELSEFALHLRRAVGARTAKS